jgi:hypothetical protein
VCRQGHWLRHETGWSVLFDGEEALMAESADQSWDAQGGAVQGVDLSKLAGIAAAAQQPSNKQPSPGSSPKQGPKAAPAQEQGKGGAASAPDMSPGSKVVIVSLDPVLLHFLVCVPPLCEGRVRPMRASRFQ